MQWFPNDNGFPTFFCVLFRILQNDAWKTGPCIPPIRFKTCLIVIKLSSTSFKFFRRNFFPLFPFSARRTTGKSAAFFLLLLLFWKKKAIPPKIFFLMLSTFCYEINWHRATPYPPIVQWWMNIIIRRKEDIIWNLITALLSSLDLSPMSKWNKRVKSDMQMSLFWAMWANRVLVEMVVDTAFHDPQGKLYYLLGVFAEAERDNYWHFWWPRGWLRPSDSLDALDQTRSGLVREKWLKVNCVELLLALWWQSCDQ